MIGKDQLGSTEKEMLRTEIAILKLVRHPNIIQLKVSPLKFRHFFVKNILLNIAYLCIRMFLKPMKKYTL